MKLFQQQINSISNRLSIILLIRLFFNYTSTNKSSTINYFTNKTLERSSKSRKILLILFQHLKYRRFENDQSRFSHLFYFLENLESDLNTRLNSYTF